MSLCLKKSQRTWLPLLRVLRRCPLLLSEKVMKTPRQVVSTAIIEEANVLLELIRIVRNFAR